MPRYIITDQGESQVMKIWYVALVCSLFWYHNWTAP